MSERGSAGLSVVLLTPVILALMAFAVLAGRIGTADQDVVSAAQAAARAASSMTPVIPTMMRALAAPRAPRSRGGRPVTSHPGRRRPAPRRTR